MSHIRLVTSVYQGYCYHKITSFENETLQRPEQFEKFKPELY